MGYQKLDKHDPLEARFRSVIRKQDAKKTGLKKTSKKLWECVACEKFHTHGKPNVCGAPHPNPLVDRPCPGRTFKEWTEDEIEAMPIGKITAYEHRRTKW